MAHENYVRSIAHRNLKWEDVSSRSILNRAPKVINQVLLENIGTKKKVSTYNKQ